MVTWNAAQLPLGLAVVRWQERGLASSPICKTLLKVLSTTAGYLGTR